jgi:hypothetical protein
VLAAVPHLACDGKPCQDVAGQIGLSGDNINAMARAFLKDQRMLPDGACGANSLSTVDACMQRDETSLAALTGIVCPKAAEADKTSSAVKQGPFTSQSISVYLRLVPGLAVDGQMSVSASLTSSCEYTITHVHDGTGAAEQSCPDQYLRRQYLANMDFEIKARGDVEVTYTHNGMSSSESVSAGSSCSTQGLVYNGCEYVQDGLACNVVREDAPPGTSNPDPWGCHTKPTRSECEACCETNAGSQAAFDACQGTCPAGP